MLIYEIVTNHYFCAIMKQYMPAPKNNKYNKVTLVRFAHMVTFYITSQPCKTRSCLIESSTTISIDFNLLAPASTAQYVC